MSNIVFYATGGVSNIGGGSDIWVRDWIDCVSPNLDYDFELVIDRDRLETDVDLGIKVTYKNDSGFYDIIDKADDLHILHGYYEPNKVILENQDKIRTNIIHCLLYKSLEAHKDLDLEWLKHFDAETSWQEKLLDVSDKTIWIGLYKTKYHDDYNIIDIPNYYEFNVNKKAVDSNIVGFAARMETRKAPHFLDNIDSIFFTRPDHVSEWRENTNFTWKKTKFYQFRWERHHPFMMRDDWGISHSAHLFEPFGYSIFQALDYGKIPIVSEDWLSDIKYDFRASSKEKFDNCYKNICDLSLGEKQTQIDELKHELGIYTNKKEWVKQITKLYK